MLTRKHKLVSACIILLIFASCTNRNDCFQKNIVQNNIGNIEGNIFGCILKHEDWYYYSNIQDNSKLYKIKTDGTMRKKLNNSRTLIIGVSNDWVLYINYSDLGTLYKIKTDGEEKTKLVDERILKATVIGDWIYYIIYGVKCNYICKIKIDGTGQMMLSNDCIGNDMVIDEDWIYYSRIRNYSLYKIKTDGTEKQSLNNIPSHKLNIEGDWVYFINKNVSHNYLCRIRTDGSYMERIIDEESLSLTVKDGWVYYHVTGLNRTKLYRARIDGSERTKIFDGGIGDIIVDGDWIYANFSRPGNIRTEIYRIKADGSTEDFIPVNY